MSKADTRLVEKSKSSDTTLFTFVRQCYEGYIVAYNIITGKMKMLLPDGETFWIVDLKKFMDETEFLLVVETDLMIQMLLDIFLLDATPEAQETLDYIETETRLKGIQINPN